MMKKLLLALLCVCCGLLQAQEAAPAVSATVPEALASPSLSYLTDTRPEADARFYIYLCSASWCTPCRAIMPKVVAEYPAIKAAGGEIILLCYDATPAAGVAYLKKYNAAFPAVLTNFEQAAALGLPGFSTPRGIPHAIFVSKDGTLLHKGHGATLLGWKQVISSLP